MLTLMLSLVLSSSAHAQVSYPGSMLLSELPDGARLQVFEQIELITKSDEAHQQLLHLCTFEDGICTPSSENHLFSSYHSQLNFRTDVEDALTKTEEGWFSDEYALSPGIYCLERSKSKFDSSGDSSVDKLRFSDCAGNLMFTIYANAGYNLRNSEGFRGYTVSEFHFHSGKSLRFVK